MPFNLRSKGRVTPGSVPLNFVFKEERFGDNVSKNARPPTR
jgi:hypothetical protein